MVTDFLDSSSSKQSESKLPPEHHPRTTLVEASTIDMNNEGVYIIQRRQLIEYLWVLW